MSNSRCAWGRATAIGGARAGRPTPSLRMVPGSVTAATIFTCPPHRSHTLTSNGNTRASSTAQASLCRRGAGGDLTLTAKGVGLLLRRFRDRHDLRPRGGIGRQQRSAGVAFSAHAPWTISCVWLWPAIAAGAAVSSIAVARSSPITMAVKISSLRTLPSMMATESGTAAVSAR